MPGAVTAPSTTRVVAQLVGASLTDVNARSHTVSLRAMMNALTTTAGSGRSSTSVASPPEVVGVRASSTVEAQTGTTIGPAATRTPDASEAVVTKIVRYALAQQGKPYVFATAGPDTFDCSGLISAAYRQVGVGVPAYTFTLATLGRAVDPKNEPIKPGDLIFVRGGRPPRDLGHAGIAISATEWIRAPATGDVVKVGPLPSNIQLVRRLVNP